MVKKKEAVKLTGRRYTHFFQISFPQTMMLSLTTIRVSLSYLSL